MDRNRGLSLLKGLFVLVLVVAAVVIWGARGPDGSSGTKAPTGPSRAEKIRASLEYLQDVPEVAWVEIQDNNVYLGFNQRPDDLRPIMAGAALNANKATGFGVHVWAVPETQRGWRSGDGPYWLEVTARHGKIE